MVALKCDQCPDREGAGRLPACVEACKTGALTYGQWQAVMADKGRAVAQAFFGALPAAAETAPAPPLSVQLWRQLG
jgi:carbon-monoxide dehydrogenase iron sulfur subunit